MFSIAGIDLLEQELLNHERTLLEILLQDKTTKKNIIWATDDYAELGEPYSFKKEILPELVTGEQDSLNMWMHNGWKSPAARLPIW